MRQVNLTALVLNFLLVLISFFCQKKSDNKNQRVQQLSGVFVAGGEDLGNGIYNGKIWVNNAPQTLTSANQSVSITSIAVSGNDIYAAGSVNDFGTNDFRGAFWKNGNAQIFGATTIVSIAVDGNDVYMAGDSSGSACIWKNGVMRVLSSPAEATSIYVSGSDVYTAGISHAQYLTNGPLAGQYVGTYPTAVVWKNGVPQYLTDGSVDVATTTSVYVSGPDVYVAGGVRNTNNVNVATLWKNGVPQKYTTGSSPAGATSVFVDGPNVYVAGSDSSEAVIWKNGIKEVLPSGTNGAAATSVYVKNGNVYVAGHVYNGTKYLAVIWKNGVIQYLTDGTNNTLASAIVVK
jgi:hypothetical protein